MQRKTAAAENSREDQDGQSDQTLVTGQFAWVNINIETKNLEKSGEI